MGEHSGACWCQGTTCSWPATQWENSIQLQEEQKKSEYLKETKKKVPGLSKNHLETSDKNIDDLFQVYQVCHETSKIHLFKNPFMLGSSPPSLIPSTHIWKGLQCCWTPPPQEKKKFKKISMHYRRGWRRYSHVINQANFSGSNKQDKSVLHWATIQINLEVKERRVYCEIK